MRTATILLMSALMASPALAQLAAPPPLDYVAVPDSFSLPAGMTLGSTSGVAINSKGHVVVLHRGPDPLMEFDPGSKFVRAFGNGFFDRPHGLRIDAQDNIWATDVATHVVYKFSPEGASCWCWACAAMPARCTPTGICACSTSPTTWRSDPAATCSWRRARARRAEGDQVRQGRQFHQGLGQEGHWPGEFDIAHSIAVDGKGLRRRPQQPAHQVFDADGTFLGIEASRHALRAVHQPRPAPVAGARARRAGDQARPRRQGARRHGQASKALGQSARRISTPV